MCVTILVDGEVVDGTHELAEKLGVPVVMYEDDGGLPAEVDQCLCGVDIPATAKAAGWKCKELDVNTPWYDWELTRPKAKGARDEQ